VRARPGFAAAGSVVLALALAAPTPASGQETGVRRYYGNMPFAVDLASRRPPQFHFTPQHIREDSTLVAIHMDWFPIPWRELAAGTPPPAAWTQEMDRIESLVHELGLPVYLAVTPIGGGNRLKPQAFQFGTALAGDDSFSRPCEPIGERPDHEDLARAYHAYVDELVRRFDPRFLAISIEVNSYTMACPEAWGDMKRFLNAEYRAQKREHPGLPVFHTFQVENLWQSSEETSPCAGFRRECLVVNYAPLADLEGDLAALSVYPIAPYVNDGRTLPWDYLSVLRPLFGKRLAVSETGYPRSTISALVPGAGGGQVCYPGLPSSTEDQARWMDRLLGEAEALDMAFVVWWSDEAPLSFDSLVPCRCTDPNRFCDFLNSLANDDERMGFRYFGLMGLRDYDGTPQPALDSWRRAVLAANERPVIFPTDPPRRHHR
jgi:hypothetical protein